MILKHLRFILIVLTLTLLTNCENNQKSNINKQEIQDEFDKQLIESKKDPMFSLDLDYIKSKQGKRFFELRKIINEHDPIRLIAIGAPEDEYESEVKTIIVQLNNDMSIQEIQDLVYQEFLRWFEDETTTGKKESYKELAKDIYEWLQKPKG